MKYPLFLWLAWLLPCYFLLGTSTTLATETTSFSLQVSDQAQQKLTGYVLACVSSSSVLPQISGKDCNYQSVHTQALYRGFSQQTHWLHIRLHNPSAQPVMRWLEVGHPRMQLVRFYQWDAQQGWQTFATGQSIPPHERPLRSSRLLLPIALPAQTEVAFYLQINAQTHVDQRMTLWRPDDYIVQQSKSQIMQALSMGGLVLAAVFAWMLYLHYHASASLWLGLTFLSQVVLDASYTGLLSAYFWPPDLAYDIRLHGMMVGFMVLFFMQFVRSFFNTSVENPPLAFLIRVGQMAILFNMIALIFWQYAIPIRTMSILALIFMLVSVWLFFRAWQQGSNPAGYLLISYMLLLLMVAYRAASSFGWLGQVPLQEYGFSWYFVLITPTSLQAVLRPSSAQTSH